jgi:hypothetical protein
VARPGAFLVDTEDIGEAQTVLSATYGKTHIRKLSPGGASRTQVWRSWLGELAIDDLAFDYQLSYDTDMPEKILLIRVRSGAIEYELPDGETGELGAGQVAAFGALEGMRLRGRVRRAHYDLVSIDRRWLSAAPAAAPESRPVRLTSMRPISESANMFLADVIDHVRHGVLASPHAVQHPFIGTIVAQYLASAMLAAFPNTAVFNVTRPSYSNTNAS